MKRIAALIILTIVCLSAQVLGQSLSNGIWKVNGNGFEGTLIINIKSVVGPIVQIEGSIYGEEIVGTYDTRIRRLNFLRMINKSQPSSYQWWVGYLFQNQNGIQVKHTLAGTFGSFGPRGTANEMIEAGWVAEMTQ